MAPAHRNTNYQNDWEFSFPWIRSVDGDRSMAKCIICSKNFHINSSGKTQVSQHAKTQNHIQLAKSEKPLLKFLPHSDSGSSVLKGKFSCYPIILIINNL